MASSSSSSSSSSLASHPLKYDVFLSFRGKDTRRGFISHLLAALRREALIETFFDADDLKSGEPIAPALPRAIQDSSVAVVVFSKDYASSSWCLNELAEIIERHRFHGQIVLPVFYKVNPSHLRKQSHKVAAAFVEHEQNPMNVQKIPRWKDALITAAGLSGNDDLLINKIVEEILEKLNRSMHFEHLVGMDLRIEEIKEVFTINPSETRILGIWGMGGIGKTTTAKVIYQMMSRHFQDRCFLENVGQRADNELSKELILKIFGEKASEKLDMLPKERLRRKKVLLVLDDVNNSQKIESLIGDPCWFGSESMILITSRDKQIFKRWADFIYDVKPLNYDKGLQLFSRMAFKQNYPRDDFALISKSFVEYTQGIPLALKVLGSHLNGRSHEDWESALTLLSEVQIDGIQQVLRISYNGLSSVEKRIFLDIACFFKQGEIYVKAHILRKIYRGFDIALSVLVDKCLVTSKYPLGMHDLIQEMGKAVVLQNDKQEHLHPYQRTRLWNHEDIYQILVENMEVKDVETITLDLSKIRELNLNPQVFTRMPYLRLLNIYGESNLHLSQSLDSLPNALQYLRWEKYPLESLPSNSLVVLELPNNNMKQLRIRAKEDSLLSQVKNGIVDGFWRLTSLSLVQNKSITRLPNDRSGFLEALEVLDLSGCSNLNTFPEISSNIKELCLSKTAIKHVPSSSVELLSKLKYLRMGDCRKLESLPNSRSGFLEALSFLDLSGCSNLKTFPEISSNIKNLHLNKTAIKQVLSSSVELLSKLENLEMSDCKELEILPSNFFSKLTSLKKLTMSRCSRFKMLPEILEPMRHSVFLDLSETAIEKLPSFIGICNETWFINMNKCSKLAFYPRSSENCFSENIFWADELYLSNCNLRELPDDLSFLSFVHFLDLSENDFERIPASFKQLSRLKVLDISYCKMLLSLPELPSNVCEIWALKCWSLKEIGTLKQLSLDSRMAEYNFDFSNCLKLDEDQCQEVVNVHLRNYTRSQMLESLAKFEMIYPGSRIPEWVKYQNMGDSIQIHLPSHWFNHLFRGFALYVPLGKEKRRCYIGYDCHFGDNDHFSDVFSCQPQVDKEHMVVSISSKFCDWLCRHRDFEEGVAFFKFTMEFIQVSEVNKGIIKKCGVIPLYAQKDEDEFCGTFDFPNLGVSKLKRSATYTGSFHCMPEKRLKIKEIE